LYYRAMVGLPSPEDLVVKVLVWFSVPTSVVAVFTSALAAAGWLKVGRSSLRSAVNAKTQARLIVQRGSTGRQRALVGFIVSSGLFLAIAYSLSQLAGVTYEKLNNGESIATGLQVSSSFLISRLLGYQHWNPVSFWTVACALTSIFALNFADLNGGGGLRAAIVFIWRYILLLGAILGVLVVIDGCSVIVLGATHSNGYKASTSLLYALWAICLWSLPWLGSAINRTSRGIYGITQQNFGYR
jgi:hypothetical protein